MAKYSREVKEFIFGNYKGIGTAELTKLVNSKFGLNLTRSQMKSFKANHHLNSGLTGRFEKGSTSFNKGRKQSEYMTPEAIERTKATRFKKGNKPMNYMPVGTELMKADGYIWVKIKDPHVWKQKHRMVWEKFHGRKLKKGELVTFLDGDVTNFDIANLQLMTLRESAIVNHKRQRSSNPDITKARIGLARLDLLIRDKSKEKDE